MCFEASVKIGSGTGESAAQVMARAAKMVKITTAVNATAPALGLGRAPESANASADGGTSMVPGPFTTTRSRVTELLVSSVSTMALSVSTVTRMS